MKERPILFSAPMVRAILDDRKTQTRRIVKYPSTGAFVCVQGYWTSQTADEWWPLISVDGESTLDQDGNETPMRCPHGKIGDCLWVRESFYQFGHWEAVPGVKTKTGRMKWKFVPDTLSIVFDADALGGSEIRKGRHHKDPETRAWHKRLGRFMPRWASRILLEITDVRVQRLQDISDEDARAEGVERISDAPACLTPWKNYRLKPGAPFAMNHSIAAASFMSLWDSINGLDAYKANPWVWAISFKRVEERAS